MNEIPLDLLAGQVRASVAAGQYPQAQASLEVYCHALAGDLEGLPPGDPAISRLEDHWRRFYKETRQQVLRDRAHAGLRLSQLLSGPKTYQHESLPRHTWQCLG